MTEKIENFLSKFKTKKSTYANYKCLISKYFEYIKENPDTYIKDVRKLDKNEFYDVIDKYESDIRSYWQYLQEKNIPDKTISAQVGVVKSFFTHYRIRLDDIVWKDIARLGNGHSAVTDDKIPTPQELKQILSHGDLKARALFLMISSSGLRAKEAVNIKISDIEFGNPKYGEPSKIKISATIAKNNQKAITFMSTEATEVVKEWLKVRDDWIRTVGRRIHPENLKTKRHKSAEDMQQIQNKKDLLFPFSYLNAHYMWTNLIEKSGYNQKDRNPKLSQPRYKYHIHSLRKYFKVHFPNKLIADALMNHKESLDKIYPNYSEDEIKKIYKDGMQNLLVFQQPVKESEIIQKQQEEIDNLNEELGNLKEDMAHMLAIMKHLNENQK